MDKELFDYVAERADVLIASGSSTQVTRDVAQAWKDAVAADEAAADEATAKLVDVLDGRPTTIDGVIAFARRKARSGATVTRALRRRRFSPSSGASSCRARAGASTLRVHAP